MGACANGVLVVHVRESGRVYAWGGTWYARVLSTWMEGEVCMCELRVDDLRFVVRGMTPFELAYALREGIVHAEWEAS